MLPFLLLSRFSFGSEGASLGVGGRRRGIGCFCRSFSFLYGGGVRAVVELPAAEVGFGDDRSACGGGSMVDFGGVGGDGDADTGKFHR